MFMQALRDVLPKLIKQLMLQAGTKTQTLFAEKTGIDLGRINRYANSREFPDEKLAQLAQGSGLRVRQVLWLFGHLLEEEHREHRFDQIGPGEVVGERAAPYGKPSLAVRLEAMMLRDLTGIEPHALMALNRQRQAIVELYEELQDGHEQAMAKVGALVDAFDAAWEAAVHRSPGRSR